MKRKWKYSPQARKKRFCEVCDKHLKREEVVLCAGCFAELLSTTTDAEEVTKEGDEEENQDEDD